MTEKEAAISFIVSTLRHGPVDTRRVMELAKQAGIKRRMIQEIRREGKIFLTISSGRNNWFWKLKEGVLDDEKEKEKSRGVRSNG